MIDSEDNPASRRLSFQAGIASPVVEGDARRRDHGVPMRDRIGEFRMSGRFRDRRAVVIVAPAHHRPAVILACLRNVDLVAALRPELALPQFAGLRIDGGALRIAVAVRPDFGPRALLADEGVVLRHRAILVDAHDLAKVGRKILGGRELEALAQGDEQLAVGSEGEPPAKMIAAVDFRLLAEDDGDVFEAVSPERAAGHRGSGAARSGFRIGEIDEPVRRKIRIECDVEQPALTLGENLGHALKRLRYRSVLGYDAEPPRPFGDEHTAVGQKCEPPRMFESVDDRRDRDRARFGFDGLVFGQTCLRHEEHRREKAEPYTSGAQGGAANGGAGRLPRVFVDACTRKSFAHPSNARALAPISKVAQLLRRCRYLSSKFASNQSRPRRFRVSSSLSYFSPVSPPPLGPSRPTPMPRSRPS